MAEIKVNLEKRSYPVVIGSKISDRLPAQLKRHVKRYRFFVFYDAQVYALHGKRLDRLFRNAGRFTSLVIPGGERSKSAGQLSRIHDFLLSERITRSDLIVACGGGVISDLVGYAAATTMRGISWMVIPTTLIGMVDASIGGKTGINHREGKNLIGSFWQPSLVWCDTEYLMTLPPRQMLNGLGEVLKYAGLMGKESVNAGRLFAESGDWYAQRELARIICECAKYKAEIVAHDETDLGRRMVLNLGHTFAHAFEAGAGFGRLLHGEALILGLKAACRLSVLQYPRSRAALEPYVDLVESFVPQLPRRKVSLDKVQKALLVDKKRAGKRPKFILLKEPGNPIIADSIGVDRVRKSIRFALAGFIANGEVND